MAAPSELRSLRPGFMTLTVAVALVVTAAIGWLAESLVDVPAARAAVLAEADVSARAEMLGFGWTALDTPRAKALAASHGVELLVASSQFSIELGTGALSGEPPNATEQASAIVSEELARYPRAFIDAARFRRVLLCRDLREAGMKIPSLPNFQRTLLFDVEVPPDFLRRLVHHELFHFVDYADDDQVQRDPAWEKLNDHWFVYGCGGRFLRDPESSRRGGPPGFVTRYAASALEEDKAETYSFMLVDPIWLGQRTSVDPVLAAKVAAIARQLERLSPTERTRAAR